MGSKSHWFSLFLAAYDMGKESAFVAFLNLPFTAVKGKFIMLESTGPDKKQELLTHKVKIPRLK